MQSAELDSNFLQQVDAIEAAYVQWPGFPSIARVPVVARTHSSETVGAADDDIDYFGSFTIDDEVLKIIDRLVEEKTHMRQPAASDCAIGATKSLGGTKCQKSKDKEAEQSAGWVVSVKYVVGFDHSCYAKDKLQP